MYTKGVPGWGAAVNGGMYLFFVYFFDIFLLTHLYYSDIFISCQDKNISFYDKYISSFGRNVSWRDKCIFYKTELCHDVINDCHMIDLSHSAIHTPHHMIDISHNEQKHLII